MLTDALLSTAKMWSAASFTWFKVRLCQTLKGGVEVKCFTASEPTVEVVTVPSQHLHQGVEGRDRAAMFCQRYMCDPRPRRLKNS